MLRKKEATAKRRMPYSGKTEMIRPLNQRPGKQRLAHIVPSFCVRSMIPEAGRDYKLEYCIKTARENRAVYTNQSIYSTLDKNSMVRGSLGWSKKSAGLVLL